MGTAQQADSGEDAIRSVLLGSGAFPLYYDVGVLCVFAAITGAMGLIAFGDLQQAK
ncbi:hypothetical protein H0O00_02810 [Candidatus Micrarchaeota archaeon]|nr:hypothetical protein [Candidatus Micrarchaeota archaeon]